MKKDNTQNKNNNSNKPITSNIVLSVIVLVIGLAMLVVGIIFINIPLMAIGGSIVTLGILMLCHFSKKTAYTPKEIDVDNINQARIEQEGREGEDFVNYSLERMLLDGEELFVSLLLPIGNNETTELDTVLVTKKGIFCIEVKNWSGTIYGNKRDKYWTEVYKGYGREDKQLFNPYIQNENHCYILEQVLPERFKADNIIIFTSINRNNDLEDVDNVFDDERDWAAGIEKIGSLNPDLSAIKALKNNEKDFFGKNVRCFKR